MCTLKGVECVRHMNPMGTLKKIKTYFQVSLLVSVTSSAEKTWVLLTRTPEKIRSRGSNKKSTNKTPF